MAALIELVCIAGLLLVFHFLIIPWHTETVKIKAAETVSAVQAALEKSGTPRIEARRIAGTIPSIHDDSIFNEMKGKYYLAVFAVFIVATFILILISLDIYRHIISPISLIASGFYAAAKKPGGQPDSLTYQNDEIGELAREYKLMSEKIESMAIEMAEREKNIIRLEEEAKKSLVEKIDERTLELEEINRELKSRSEELQKIREVSIESEARHRALAESTFDVSCETDIGGNYLYISPNNEELLGFKPDEMLGKNFSEFVHPQDIHIAFGAFQKGLNGLKAEATLRFLHKNGHYIWIESTGGFYQTASGEIRAIIVSRDISVRRKQDEELFESEKMAALNNMANGLAHDFNNIITCVGGNVALLKKCLPQNEKACEIVGRIEKILTKASRLTKKLVSDSFGDTLNLCAADVNVLIKSAFKSVFDGGEYKTRYNLELKEGLWAAEADESQALQMIVNIVKNSAESMNKEGDIEVKTENLIVFDNDPSLVKAGRYVKITVRDSRGEIDIQTASKMLDPYFLKERQKDGLELYNSYSIVKNHNGYLTVKPLGDKGAVFTILMPALQDQAKSAAEVSAQSRAKAEMKKARVLLMDDDEEILQSLNENLVEEGYLVNTSVNGEDAFKIYKSCLESGTPFDVVVLDLIVPGGLGGAETIKKISEIDPGVRAIVSSGYSNDPIMAEHQKFGFSGVIAKPYEIKTLCEIIDSLCSEKV